MCLPWARRRRHRADGARRRPRTRPTSWPRPPPRPLQPSSPPTYAPRWAPRPAAAPPPVMPRRGCRRRPRPSRASGGRAASLGGGGRRRWTSRSGRRSAGRRRRRRHRLKWSGSTSRALAIFSFFPSLPLARRHLACARGLLRQIKHRLCYLFPASLWCPVGGPGTHRSVVPQRVGRGCYSLIEPWVCALDMKSPLVNAEVFV
mmetsp:Transcript_58710/g.191467  ORF Transcript_58710/g.191467 Transcript_58710/m.191467 type:complete len:203 (-) Transcript_58710:184-792(-)